MSLHTIVSARKYSFTISGFRTGESGTFFIEVSSLMVFLANFEDAQKKILYCHRINISANRKCCTTVIWPTAKMKERHCQSFNLLHQRTFFLHLCLALDSQPFGQINVECIVFRFFL